jgi:hypothetical protein
MSQVTSKLLVVGSAIQAIFGFAGVAAKADDPYAIMTPSIKNRYAIDLFMGEKEKNRLSTTQFSLYFGLSKADIIPAKYTINLLRKHF